ncbi:MAG: hypothetical protein KGL39_28880 [Patescibacteria group bacterium]|nr:hypothetical protein [Patescibacteria group bacterium]
MIQGKFDCILDRIIGEIAHVTFKDLSGETFYLELLADQFNARGIREGRRFKLVTVEEDGRFVFSVEPIPDVAISTERELEIDAWLEESLGPDDAPQDDL